MGGPKGSEDRLERDPNGVVGKRAERHDAATVVGANACTKPRRSARVKLVAPW
jgi:hypothetical protein